MELFRIYKSNIETLIETGTFQGDGIQKAIDAGYKKIYSCDINEEYVKNAREKYKDKNVKVLNHPSNIAIEKILEEVDERCMFWLDGHSMPFDMQDKEKGFGSDTVKEGVPACPLKEEIKAISKHKIKNHTILIDDTMCFGTWVFDNVTFEEIRDMILEINDYKYKHYGNRVCFYVEMETG